MTDWDSQAKRAANYITEKLSDAPRGVFLWHNGVYIAFANDEYMETEHSQMTINLLRRLIQDDEAGLEELGFGECDAPFGYTWVMLLRQKEGPRRDYMAVRNLLEDLVWGVTNILCGRHWTEPRYERVTALEAMVRELE